ncbi:GntR family transcriptional regulator [Streptomyces cavernicola]|uniref:GntR family transcriptional regulator n=1 Tax=Streptomyces cavernicola TaxID=3043613 RepID=A0ABT6SE11_9ACTN|nr:GntR family transcriptional regulator [Streptomyces sp. B-S-A6]MDI3406437.1 GntR family transcriptional regulator [Streptomyces sp. B-S-A6]
MAQKQADGGAERRTGGGAADLIERLEQEIVLGTRFPRERLVEDELMERYDAKRHVVRSALKELESQGLVERRRNIGSFVRAYTAKELRDVYAVRELLETHCAGLIELPVAIDRLAALTAIQKDHDAAVDTADLPALVHSNTAFHQVLFGLADNAALVETINRHARMTHAVRSVTATSADLRERSRKEHWAIIRALTDGDRESLVETCRAHLLPSRDAYLQRVATH